MSATITSAVSQTAIPQLCMSDPGDAEAALFAEAIHGARQQRKLHTAIRQQAQQEQIDQLSAAAAKLRSMAVCSVLSGIVQGAASVATAVLSGINTGREVGLQKARDATNAQRDQIAKLSGAAHKAASAELGRLNGVLRVTPGASPWIAASEKLVDGFARADIPARVSAHLEADKRELEIGAEQAAKRAEDARDQIGEADRLQGSLRSQLERLYQARQAGLDAVVRG